MAENRHLINVPNREDVAVERLLDLLPQLHPAWYGSIDIDHTAHWALVRPLLRQPLPDLRQAEIDIVLGRMALVSDHNGQPTFVWPPPTDFLVAVEAKCALVTLEDTQPWSGSVTPKSNLRDQLERNIRLGFHRVAALHIVVAPPSEDYWGVMNAAVTLGRHHLPTANGHILDLVKELPVGHAVLAIAGVSWKHEGLSGTVLPMKIAPARPVGMGVSQAALSQINQNLAACPPPKTACPVYVQTSGKWLPLESAVD